MAEIYLDNAATTRCDEEAAEAMRRVLLADYGNPSSMHRKGYEAECLLKQARRDLAGTLGVSAEEVFFTSGGTESDNLALIGSARANARRGRHIVTTAIEHAAVARTVEALEGEGFSVTVLQTDAYGLVDPQTVADAVRQDTILVSVMAVNNEIGAVQDLRGIGRLIREKNPEVLLHTDAVQGYGKVPIDVRACGIDLLAASAHKFHGPKGAGFLYVKKGTKIQAILYGGGQQEGLRSGTDNVPGAVGMATAAVRAIGAQAQFAAQTSALRDELMGALAACLENVRFNGPAGSLSGEKDVQAGGGEALRSQAAPHIISLSVPGVRAEVLLHALEDQGIYVSAGSACSSHAAKKIPGTATLRAIGLAPDCLESTIRISLSRETTEEEIGETVRALGELVPLLRRFQRG